MASELRDSRVLKPQTSRILFGTFSGWGRFTPTALIIATCFYLITRINESGPVHLVPSNPFDWLVIVSGILLAGYIGYSNNGVILAMFVVGCILFGAVYHWSMTSGLDTPDPGLPFAFIFAVVSAIFYGGSSYVIGRTLRMTAEYIQSI